MMPDTSINHNHDSSLSTMQVYHQDFLPVKNKAFLLKISKPLFLHKLQFPDFFKSSFTFFKSSFAAQNAKNLWHSELYFLHQNINVGIFILESVFSLLARLEV